MHYDSCPFLFFPIVLRETPLVLCPLLLSFHPGVRFTLFLILLSSVYPGPLCSDMKLFWVLISSTVLHSLIPDYINLSEKLLPCPRGVIDQIQKSTVDYSMPVLKVLFSLLFSEVLGAFYQKVILIRKTVMP